MITEINFTQKYLKYKQKYLLLQDQFGGVKEKQFINCAILQLSFTVSSTHILNMALNLI